MILSFKTEKLKRRQQTDWEKFRNLLKITKEPITSKNTLENSVENLEQQIQAALQTSTKEEIYNYKNKIPKNIREMQKAMNKIKKQYMRTLSPQHKK